MIALMPLMGDSDPMLLPDEFQPECCFLDSATYGLPPSSALKELAALTAAWAAGTYDPVTCDRAIARARGAFARMHSVPAADVAIGHQVSPLVGVIAGSLSRGARVLAAEGDFTSLLFPFLAAGCRLTCVPLERLAETIDADTDLVAVSAVQSASGRVADLEAIAQAARQHRVLTVVDGTQACGWLPIDAGRFSVLVAGGYKWLCHPRGTAFMTIAPELRERLTPLAAGWYASEQPWESCYGTPLRLAADARRFDISPAWFSWHLAAITLEAFERLGVGRIHEHNVALAERLRAGLGLEPQRSAIVSLDAGPGAAEQLAAAGVKASVRAGRLRLSCHLYNAEQDVDRALEALSAAPRSWDHIGEHEPVALNRLADHDRDRRAEVGTVHDERVELAVLATRIDPRAQLFQEALVIPAARQLARRLRRVDAGDNRAHTQLDQLAGELRRRSLPEREVRPQATAREHPFAIVAHVREEQITKHHDLHPVLDSARDGRADQLLVALVAARPGQLDGVQGQPECCRLGVEQLAADAMHRHPRERGVEGRQHAHDLKLVRAQHVVQRERTVLAGGPADPSLGTRTHRISAYARSVAPAGAAHVATLMAWLPRTAPAWRSCWPKPRRPTARC